MLKATINGKKTMMLGATLGKISRVRMRQSDAPDPIAAWMNSRSFSDNTMPRNGLAT